MSTMKHSSPPPLQSKPKTTAKTVTVTPPGGSDYSNVINQRMRVEKGIVDELLLVCGVIGSSSSDNPDEMIPVTDCLNWLQDLQRALRRDDDTYRPISLLMSNWKVVPQKLLPLVMTCRYDNAMVLTVVKILVILTKPISETTRKAGRMVIDTKSKRTSTDVIHEQIKLRENALAQSDMLMEYKRAVVHHSSHIQSKKNTKDKANNGIGSKEGLLSIFVSLLAEPLSKTGTSRTETDHLTIELVLHLFRNLLSAEPILRSGDTSSRANLLHQEMIELFDREIVLDIILVLAQEMESRENAQYNLLVMELLHHLLKNQDPTAVARSFSTKTGTKNTKTIPRVTTNTTTAGKENNKHKKTSKSNIAAPIKSSGGGALRAQLQREAQKFQTIKASRHSHFAGTLVAKRRDGTRQYLSATALLPSQERQQPLGVQKRKNRKSEPFVGSGKTCLSHTRTCTSGAETPAAKRAQRTLHKFLLKFTNDCYGPVMKSLKNEFRRDSARLEEGDMVVFFRIIWFICQWKRVSSSHNSNKESSSSELGQLIFTMDVFTFNLVMNATDTFTQHKKHTQLAQAVALYREMMFLLSSMHDSKDETESLMALGLLDKLFYGSEPLDRLPKLLSKWMPAVFTREYLCDLVEMVHITLKLLESNSKAPLPSGADEADKLTTNNKNLDAVARMKATAAEFDIQSYFTRKIVSNQLIEMYTHLLSQYAVNAPQINHRIVALFLRLCKTKIFVPEEEQHGALAITKPVTLQPMLYNIQLICVWNEILNDPSIQAEDDYKSLLSFATSIMAQFHKAATANPMLHVECLFRHAVPHRFCELSSNMYVNEELRMIAERDLLLEEQRRLHDAEEQEQSMAEAGAAEDQQQQDQQDAAVPVSKKLHDESDDEEETEWVVDDLEPGGAIPKKAAKRKKSKGKQKVRKSVVEEQNETDDSSDSSEENEPDSDPLSKDSDTMDENGDEQANTDSSISTEKDSAKRKVDSALEDDSDSAPPAESVPAEKKQRLRKLGGSDDSDDDDFDFGVDPVASSDKRPNTSRLIIDDDDDDED